MENREHPRIQIAIEVEVAHPLIGRKTLVARDLSDDGVYIEYRHAPFKPGSTLSVTLCSTPLIHSRPTPTAKMRVVRVDETGFALTFENISNAHLWRSVDLGQRELQVGRDLFRIYSAAVVRHTEGSILVVQQNRRWLFPGHFLHCGSDWCASLELFLHRELDIRNCTFVRTVMVDSQPGVVATDGVTMTSMHLLETPDRDLRLKVDSAYKRLRWLDNVRQVEDLRFSDKSLRDLTLRLLRTREGRDDQADDLVSTAQA